MPHKNPEDLRAYRRQYYAKNKERIEKSRQERLKEADVLERRRETCRRYYERNKEEINKKSAAWKAKNKEKNRQWCKRYRDANIERERQRCSDWQKENRAKGCARTMRRYARKVQATPSWLTPEHHAEMEQTYNEARRLGLHVDHIIPLKSSVVCGLHVPWNLQLLPPEENASKSNKLLAA